MAERSIFQSTLPARGATYKRTDVDPATKISIHAPREGSDSEIYARQDGEGVFQSTLPARGATVKRVAVKIM